MLSSVNGNGAAIEGLANTRLAADAQAITIGPMTIYHAANNVSKDFAHPDEDRWSKIVKAATDAK